VVSTPLNHRKMLSVIERSRNDVVADSTNLRNTLSVIEKSGFDSAQPPKNALGH
jgi:hypothetical protein